MGRAGTLAAVAVGALAMMAAAQTAAFATPPKYQIVTNGAYQDLAGTPASGEADCPGRTVAYGGGASIDSTSPLVNLKTSAPFINGSGWDLYTDNASAADADFTVYAVCAKKRPDYAIATATAAAPADRDVELDAFCPAGEILGGGGGYGNPFSLGQTLNASLPQFGMFQDWQVKVTNSTATAGTAVSFAICGTMGGRRIKWSKTVLTALPGQTTATVLCPAGKVPISGGADGYADTLVNIGSSIPVTGGWQVTINSTEQLPVEFQVYVVCVT